MPADRLGDALAAAQAGGEQVELVGLVGGRAGGTHRGPAVPAGLQEGGVRLPLGRVDGADLAGLWVGVVDSAAQAHRVGAVAGRGALLGPPLIARAGPVDDLLEDAGQQLPDLDGLGHAASPGSGTTRSPGACSFDSSAGSARSPIVARMMAATWWWSTCGVRTRWN